MKKLLFFVLLVFRNLLLFSQSVNLSGAVCDASNKESLPGAHLHIAGTNRVVVSGSDGKYTMPLPKGETVAIEVTFVGYTSARFEISLQKDSVVNISMHPDGQLTDVYVYGARSDFGVNSTQMSAIAVPVESIKAVPAVFGEVDVMKVLQKLPGVQSANDGTAGIFVRGGNYDQNLITLDGSTLYNSEHLKGFVSAINADMVNNVVLYKGGFPARYGARLSGVIDIGIKEGDFEEIKGSVGVGMLSSKIHVEGPVFRGRTSFNVGARASYFDAVVMPLLEKVYNKPESVQPYAKMNYYDINAKLVHRFSENDKLSAVFYWGKDVNDSAPTESSQNFSASGIEYSNERGSKIENNWGNMVSSLFYTHKGDNLRVNTNLSFSRYDYMLKNSALIDEEQKEAISGKTKYRYFEDSYIKYKSQVNDIALATDFLLLKGERHDIRWGAKYSWQSFDPTTDVYKDSYKLISIDGGQMHEIRQFVDTLLGTNLNMHTLSLYAEDDFKFGKRWSANIGLRYSLYGVKWKTYHSLEPRVALKYLVNDKMALKASYSKMAQGLHLLSSSNLVMPSDIWVPVTKEIPLMRSEQLALGYNYNIAKGVDLSVEGYYKTMDNVLEYAEGSSYTKLNGGWEQQVVKGEGKAYGVELLLEKKAGNTTGWVGYTWAKSLRKFDIFGQEINGGEEFYAGNDRRHNLNIVFLHKFNEHWKVSASWTYQSGRRGTVTTTSIYGGKPDEFDAYGDVLAGSSYMWGETSSSNPEKIIHLNKLLKYYTTTQRNGFVLPDVHRLDVGVNYTTITSIGNISVSLDICNVYNRMNISNVFIGYQNNQTVLKGVCMLSFMPSINVNLTF